MRGSAESKRVKTSLSENRLWSPRRMERGSVWPSVQINPVLGEEENEPGNPRCRFQMRIAWVEFDEESTAWMDLALLLLVRHMQVVGHREDPVDVVCHEGGDVTIFLPENDALKGHMSILHEDVDIGSVRE